VKKLWRFLLCMQFSSLLGPNILLNIMFSYILNLSFSLNVRD
jgi:hypothetical protein